MLKRKYLFFLCLLPFFLNAQDEDLFELTLEELLKIELAGDVVKSIELNSAHLTNNAFKIINLDIPASVEIMGADSINARGIKNIVEVVSNMNGILSGESPSEPYSFSTRGFSRDSINVVYDGISMGVATFNTRPLSTFNVQQVEFIKGPSELGVGQGGAGGTVNIITKKARLLNYHTRELLLSKGEFDSRTVNIGLSGPLSKKVAYRIDFSRNSSDGWVDDSSSYSTNVSSSALWQVTPSFELLFSLSKQNDSLPAYWGTPFVPISVALSANNGVIESDTNLLIDKKMRYINYNVSDHEISSDSSWKRVDFKWVLSNKIKVHGTLYGFKADRHWQNAENYFYNPELAAIERDRLLVTHKRDNWGMQTGIDFEQTILGKPSKTSVNLGLHVIDFDRDIGFNLASPSLYWDAVDLYQPEPGLFGEVDFRNDSLLQKTSNVVIDNVSELSDKLSLHTQFRFESINFDIMYINWNGTVRDRATIDTNFNEVSYKLALNYKWTDNSSIYTQYTQSHDPVFDDYSFTYEAKNLSPSDVSQWELGYKGIFHESNTELTVAVYQIEKAVNTQIEAGGAIFISDVESSGLEISINSKISQSLSVGANASFTDAEFGHYYEADIGVFANGNSPVNVPEQMLNFRASYLFDALPLELGLSTSYISSRWANSANTIKLKSYNIHNLFLAYHADKYYLGLHLNNVSDKIYGPWSDIFYPNQVVLGSPKNVELTFKINF